MRQAPDRRYSYISDDVLVTLPADDNPLADMEVRRRMEALQAAIARLPEEAREILTCIALEGLSYEQTAALLQLPIGTVRSRLSRARERLSADLKGPGHD